MSSWLCVIVFHRVIEDRMIYSLIVVTCKVHLECDPQQSHRTILITSERGREGVGGAGSEEGKREKERREGKKTDSVYDWVKYSGISGTPFQITPSLFSCSLQNHVIPGSSHNMECWYPAHAR